MRSVRIQDVQAHLPACSSWSDVADHIRPMVNERTVSVRKDIPVGPSDIASYPLTVWFSELVAVLKKAGFDGEAARVVVNRLIDNELLEMLATVSDPREDSILRFTT